MKDAEPHHTLLWFLRERLGLTGGAGWKLEDPWKQRNYRNRPLNTLGGCYPFHAKSHEITIESQ